ncbi:hypothetical protein [Rhodoplanes sp. Z2-YC6860]|uniref:hypothetical protein n=1 Tax=Rhodoplanes sp. Z2-YC6860 TaxID=674703 RepID=UPI0012EE2C7D|nr:hypothetical protein [Rhodoplanes sp. Z2-YC6860]
MMVFGNGLEEIAVDSWGIDELIVRKVGTVLGNRFTVRRINFPKATLAALESPGGGLFRNTTAEWDQAVAAAARASGKCDLTISVYRTGAAFSNTNQTLFGLGIVSYGAELMGSYYLFAHFAIRIYDGNTFAVLKTEVARTETTLASVLTGVGGLTRRVDKTWWPETPQAAVQSAQIRDGIRTLVNQSLEKTLPGML